MCANDVRQQCIPLANNLDKFCGAAARRTECSTRAGNDQALEPTLPRHLPGPDPDPLPTCALSSPLIFDDGRRNIPPIIPLNLIGLHSFAFFIYTTPKVRLIHFIYHHLSQLPSVSSFHSCSFLRFPKMPLSLRKSRSSNCYCGAASCDFLWL